MKSRGFSLVELIIVIAIMAILVGIMAPMLIRYIEKTNVSADVQFCDTVREAINIARSDPDIRNNETDDSSNQISYLEDGSVYSVGFFVQSSAFTDEVEEIIGSKIIGDSANDNILNSRKLMKSRVAKNHGELKMQIYANNLYVWIDYSDFKGGDSVNTCSSYADVETSGVIYSR